MRPDGGAEVVVEHASKSFEDGKIRALTDVSLELGRGEFVALTGPSGCGKSTLLNLIGALDRPDAGSIVVAGEQLEQLDDPDEYRASVVGFVFQFHNLIPTLTALENVQVPLFGRGQPRRAREETARALLEEVGLADRIDNYPPTLSGGERQRVAIARALAAEPKILVCDEVTSALDVSVQAAIIELLGRLRNEMGLSLLFITHDLALIRTIADNVAVMNEGRIVELGATEQIFTAPGADYTRQLLANTPSIEVVLGHATAPST